MFKKLVLLSSLLITSMTAHAGLIQYGNYTRDSASEVVTGGGLEWLKWDVTNGMSIEYALQKYNGWRLASNNEMGMLYNHFTFGKTDWTGSEAVSQFSQINWSLGDELSTHKAFLDLFGRTYFSRCSAVGEKGCSAYDDPREYAIAVYGDERGRNQTYNYAYVVEDYQYIYSNGNVAYEDSYSVLSPRHQYYVAGTPGVGVALVRNSVPVPNAVPTPGSIGLLALGLVALGYRRRHVLGR